MLGAAHDDPEFFLRAAAYLVGPPAFVMNLPKGGDDV
jgi:hypothetical protein